MTSGRDISRVLTAPVQRRAWADLAYLIAGVVLSVLGFTYVLVGFVLAVGSSITALGLPLLSVLVPATRSLGRARLALVRVLLGVSIPGPGPLRTDGGAYARVRAGLRDGPGWRAVAFQVASLPLAVVSLAVVAVSWGWGLVALTAPLQRALHLNESALPPGRRGVIVLGLAVDSWPRVAVLSVCGGLLVLIAPWAVRMVLALDRLLVTALLGRDDRTVQITALRDSRAAAVGDAAATLRRIERDLHDGIQARLVALTMNLAIIDETLDRDPPTCRAMVGVARENTSSAIRELREVIQGVHPPILDNGLDAAIATLAARCPIPVTCDVTIDRRPAAAIETIAYFCLTELLTNVIKHSGAAEARVEVKPSGAGLRLTVTDDGRGGAGEPGGTGLRGLAERVATVDGTLTIDSPSGGPTVITINLPLQP